MKTIAEQIREYVELINQPPVVYTYEELFTFVKCELFEQTDSGNWEIQNSNAFNRGWKKHKKNPKITAPFDELVNFIVGHTQVPQITEYPPKFKVHRLHANNRAHSPNMFQAHLSGTKIILQFEVIPADKQNQLNQLKLIHIGTHQEVGQS